MIPYVYETAGNTFNDNIRFFAHANGNNILHSPSDTERIMKQLNGHIEVMKKSEAFDKASDYKNKSLNMAFTKSKPEFVLGDYFHQNNILKERYRPNLIGLSDLRPLIDPIYRYHKSIGGKYENYLVDYYSQIEDEYYTKLFVANNLDEPE